MKVVLFSGGIDSLCLSHAVKPDKLLYFDLGLPENKFELEHMKKLNLPYELVIDDRFRLADQKLPNEVLPFRNLFLIVGAFFYGDEIYLGATSSSTNRDKNPTFANMLLELCKYIAHVPSKNPPHLLEENMKILMPFKTKTKSQFIKEYLENGGSRETLLATRSCYDSKELECGVCQSCIRKFVAFTNNGLPTNFNINPQKFLEHQAQRVQEINQNDVHLEIKKCITILQNKLG